MAQFGLIDFSYIGKQVREGIGEVRLRPGSGFQENIHNGLLLDEVLCSFSRESLGNSGCFCIIDTRRRSDPIFLNRPVVLHTNSADHLGRSLEGFLQQCGHVEILRQQEDMRHEVFSRLFGREGISEFFVLLDDRPEDVSKFVDGQRFSKDHLVQGLGHSSEHDLVTPHQPSIQKLVHQWKFGSLATENMLSDGIDEDWRDLVPDFGIVLQEGVRVSVESVLV